MREPRCVNSGILPKSTSRHFPSSCNQAAGRAFWKYRCFANSLLSDERQQSRSTADVGTALFEQPQRATIQITQDRVCWSLHVVGHWRRMAAVSSSLRTGRIFGRAAAGRNVRDFPDDFPLTFPLPSGSTQPAGIPLGSTEIATPGISPVAPSQSTLMESCAGFDGARSSTALFDGGGMSSLSCADSQTISSPLPSPSSIGRVGIPLGATELGGAGISPAAPVAGPSLSGAASPITDPGNP
jgi:hypothetical protein